MTADTLVIETVRRLGLALFERGPGGAFTPLVPPPDWLEQVFDGGDEGPHATLGAALPYLEYFLPEADRVWDEGGPATAESGVFTVPGDSTDLLVRARAFTLAGRSVLVVERLSGEADARPMLQTARDQRLAFETLEQRAAAVQTPAADIAARIAELAGAVPPEAASVVQALAEANARLQAAVAPLPHPPRRPHRR